MGKLRLLLPVLLLWVILSGCTSSVSFHPAPVDDVLINPMTGYAPWATYPELITDEQTLVYVDLKWRDWEPQPGVYDVDVLEKSKNLTRWRMEGKRVVFRFVCDVPGDERHMDIPDWLYALTNGNGDWYENDYGQGYAPDYTDPVFIERHEKAVKALGEWYGKDDFFCFIELGSIGHWGEWHVDYDSGIRKLPKASVREQYVRHYLEAFPKSHLLMRRPFAIAASEGLGLYNDMTGHPEDTLVWLDWINNGGEYLQASEGMGALKPMPEGWMIAPVGGEFTSSIPMVDMLGSSLNTTLGLLKSSHTTFIGPKTPLEDDDIQSTQYQKASEIILKTIGYRLRIEKAEIAFTPILKNKLKIGLTWMNEGIAPFYYNWDVHLYLFDQNDNIVIKQNIDTDITKIIPGQKLVTNTLMDISRLDKKRGTYKIGLAIIDPVIDAPGIAFAMENSRNDKIYILGAYTFE